MQQMVLNILSCVLLVLHPCAAYFFTFLCLPSQLAFLDATSPLGTLTWLLLQFKAQK